MLLNSYRGVNLQDTGRFNISSIYVNVNLNPIYKGLRFNNVKDVVRGKHIHFCTFKFQLGDNLYNWIKANGTAFDLLYVDRFSAIDWFCFG